ncbi:hypothetical protein DPH57_08000 [Massilia sp. YMA4]|nr:hypothetical protein DPH57_08000 [Massilia sp. YMA4]
MPGVVCVVICAGCISGLLGIGAIRKEASALEGQRMALELALLRNRAVPVATVSRLSLPGPESLPAISATIPTLLQRYQVALVDIAFSPTKVHVTVARSSQVVLHLRGTYGNVKGILQELLARNAGVALQALSMRRAKTTDTAVDAEVRLDVYYRERQ